MAVYTVFSRKGPIVRIISKPQSDGPPGLKFNETFIPGNHKDKIIFVTEKSQAITLHEKPESSITLATGDGFFKLENLENPTRIIITGNHASFHRVITDGEYEFSIDDPGEYLIKCRSDVEQPIEFKVTIE